MCTVTYLRRYYFYKKKKKTKCKQLKCPTNLDPIRKTLKENLGDLLQPRELKRNSQIKKNI